ncbi:uncharacterized protein LOC119303009 isoform X2 [Triticum dicoccoides]|uniref:uncharacterized protein LOC119303009 isoform X2 n=1 Tax=Triticum dicoccoides TaxID=85692 RepID=UPI00188E0D35|nr:uncharacterized protein LOC119303009 isoform X2 [Triticum dicoccoides]
MVLQRSSHGVARRRRSFNAASMVLGRSYNRASTKRRCCVGARSELQQSFAGAVGALLGVQWSSAGVAIEFAGASLLRWSFVRLQWSSPEAVGAEFELPAGLQCHCVEAVALAAACLSYTEEQNHGREERQRAGEPAAAARCMAAVRSRQGGSQQGRVSEG